MTESRAATPPSLSVVVPVYNEGEAVVPVLRALDSAIAVPHEILVVYDFDGDTTVPVIRRLETELPAVRGHRNDIGRGVLNSRKPMAMACPSQGPTQMGSARRPDSSYSTMI